MSTFARKLSQLESRIKRQEALKLLCANHELVSTIYEHHEFACSYTQKTGASSPNLQGTDIHAPKIEKEFLSYYQGSVKDTELMPETRVEHQTLKT